jgi:NADPH2:quinone reductase
MAERTVVSPKFCFPIPAEVDDSTAAAVFNPGLSAWGSLVWRAQFAAGETVLILGATGVTGKLAIQIAKIFGAKRVIAAGRNQQVLDTLPSLGADATIRFDDAKFAAVCAEEAIDVVLDYVWGAPTEALLAAITRKDLNAADSRRIRLVQIGEGAGATISVAAATLRSSRLEILGAGTGSAPPLEKWAQARGELMSLVAAGKLRIDVERMPLAEIEKAWHRDAAGRRVVIIP